MRIQILSDLHLEFDHDGGESFAENVPVAGDVLVLSGGPDSTARLSSTSAGLSAGSATVSQT